MRCSLHPCDNRNQWHLDGIYGLENKRIWCRGYADHEYNNANHQTGDGAETDRVFSYHYVVMC